MSVLQKDVRPSCLQVMLSGVENCGPVTTWTSASLGPVHRRSGRGAEPALMLVVLSQLGFSLLALF